MSEQKPDMARLPKAYRDYVRGLERELGELRAAMAEAAPDSCMAWRSGITERRLPEGRVRWYLDAHRQQFIEAHLEPWDGGPVLEVYSSSALVVWPRVSNVVLVQSEWTAKEKGGAGG